MSSSPEELECLGHAVRVFRYIGAWPRWDRIRETREKLYACYTVFMTINLIVYLYFVCSYAVIKHKKWRSLDYALEDMVILITGILVLCKVILVLVNQKKLISIIDRINFDLKENMVKTAEDRQEIVKCIRHEKLLIKIYVGGSWSIVIIYNLGAIIRFVKNGFHGDYSVVLPHRYPVVITSFPMFILAGIHQEFVTVQNGTLGTVVDAFFSAVMYHLQGQLTIMGNQIQSQGAIIPKKYFIYHNKALELIAMVVKAFEKFLIVIFLIDSMEICICLLHVSKTTQFEPVNYGKFFFLCIIKLGQCYLYCWYGQKVINKCEEICFACYSSKWYEKLRGVQLLNLRIIMQRAQKPPQMRAGFFTLSVSTLVNVLNGTYSLFAMFNTFRK